MSADRVDLLRRAFDATFAVALPSGDRPATQAVLLVRVARHALALRLHEVAAFQRAPRIVPLPGGPPALLGLGAVQGRLVPVYGLAQLLGEASEGRAPRWIVLVDRAEPIALSFTSFEGHAELPAREISSDPLAHGAPVARFATGLARIGGTTREVLDLGAVLAAIRALAQPHTPGATARGSDGAP